MVLVYLVGEKGALEGPSIMPGGQKEAYDLVADVLEEISAKAPEDGKPCVTYIGPDGAGHYVKMVHNGIEYGDMQLIAESYDLMQHLLGLSAEDMAEIFTEWNKGELDSYLIEITADILKRKDDEGQDGPIVDYILDAAGNKGTGKWTSQSALDLGVPLSLITESVFARYISAYKEERVHASKVLPKPAAFKFEGDKAELIEKIRQALYFSKSSLTHKVLRNCVLLLKKTTGTCHLRTSHLSGAMDVSSVLVSCKRSQMLTIAMQILLTFYWMSTSWMSLLSTNNQFVTL